MRRFVTLLAGAVLLAVAGVASASSHGQMPAGLGFIQIVQWELTHFTIHMQLTSQAIQAGFVSPQLGWALLDSQSLCASQGYLTAHLFGTGTSALATFLGSDLVVAATTVKIALFVRRRIGSPSTRMFSRLALA